MVSSARLLFRQESAFDSDVIAGSSVQVSAPVSSTDCC
jgi:hypothetical protein